MLVSYIGWGYLEYEIDYDDTDISKEERWARGSVGKGQEERVEGIIFELPKQAQIELKVHGKKTVDYLLFSDYTHFDGLKLRINLPQKDEGRFCLCEEEPIYNKDGYPQQHERKKVTYTISDVFEAKEQTESLQPTDSISDQQAIDVVNVATEAISDTEKSRRPRPRPRPRSRQIELLLSVIDELKYDRLNIPIGEKQTVLKKCLMKPKVFLSASVFNRVWSELSVAGQISIADKEKFLKIQ